MDPRQHLWKWQRSKSSADLNQTRRGEWIVILMQYEGMSDDLPEPADEQNPLPMVFLKTQATVGVDGRRGIPKFITENPRGLGKGVQDSTLDYKSRLGYMYCFENPSKFLRLWNKVAEGKVDADAKEEFKVLDEKYQPMLVGAAAEERWKWDTEKHMFEAICDGC
jgi:hypothetical protein